MKNAVIKSNEVPTVNKKRKAVMAEFQELSVLGVKMPKRLHKMLENPGNVDLAVKMLVDQIC